MSERVEELEVELDEAHQIIGEQAHALVADRREYLALTAACEMYLRERDAIVAEIHRCVEAAPNADAKTAYEWLATFAANTARAVEGTD